MSEAISGMVIDGKFTLSSGMVLEDATVSPGGVLSALAGGTATNLTVEDGASLHMAVDPDTVVQGTSAGVPFVNSGGYLSGYVHEPTSITRIAISSGGTAVDITCVEGWINVSAGGLLSNSYVSSYGRLGLNGGDAIGVTVEAGAQFFVTVGEGTNLDITSGGRRIVATDGVIDNIAADGAASAWYYITSGGSAINTVGNNKMWLAVSNGYASNTILRASGNPTGTNRARLDLRSGGVTEATFISAGGSMSVANDRSTASNTFIYEGGILDLVSTAAAEGDEAHLYAKDTYVFSGGTMLIKQNTVVTGELQIEDGAKVTLSGNAATLDFDITDRTTADDALYNNYGLITGAANANHTISLLAEQDTGTYRLADNAASFAATVTVKTADETLGELAVGGVLNCGAFSYALTLDSAALSLTIAAAATTVHGDLNGDGRADVILTIAQPGHDADGATGAWLIQESQTAAWGDLSQRNADWELFGTGVTAAGKSTNDVYLKSADNVVGAWTTDADGKVSGWVTVGEFDADTQVLGLGDFDGDGQTDLLLRNTNGAVGCFFTGGDKTGWNYFQSLGDEWTVSAVGDLNGDGRSDVVLANDAGYAGSWLTQSDGTVAWADLDTLADGFVIVGTGDFDGDGTSDVLLQKGSYFGAWIVEDGGIAGWMGLGELGDVTVEQIADFDADGIDDLRIRTADGDIGALLVKGADTLDWRYYGSVGPEWSTSLAAI